LALPTGKQAQKYGVGGKIPEGNENKKKRFLKMLLTCVNPYFSS